MSRPQASLADWVRWASPDRVSLPGAHADGSPDFAMVPVAGRLQLDSRRVGPGDVFAAIKGTRTDGHAHISDAIRAGASLVLCDPSYAPAEGSNVYHLHVAGLAERLGAIAQASEGWPARRLTLIGVTGTNGKTTVATLVWQMLRRLGVKASLLGTAGGRLIDAPMPMEAGKGLTTADAVQLADWMRRMVDGGSTHLVMEVSSHALDQHRVGGLGFDIALFTNLTHDHLDYHGTMDAYARAKKRLFDGLKRDALSIVNLSDGHGGYMVSDTVSNVIGLMYRDTPAQGPNGGKAAGSGGGSGREAGGAAGSGSITLEYAFRPSGGMDLTLSGERIGRQALSTPLMGRFNAMNIAQAFVAVTALGMPAPQAAEAIASLQGAEGRMQLVARGCPGEPMVFVDYAHTPDALANVLQTGVEIRDRIHPDGALVVVFGAGGDRDRGKRPVMASVAERFADRIIITSDNPRSESAESILDDICRGFSAISPDRWERIADRREAIRRAISISGGSDIVLLAGKGHETTQEIAGVHHPFDDRREALTMLEERFPC